MNKPVIVLRCLKCMLSSLSECAFVSICLIIASFVMRFFCFEGKKFEKIQETSIGQAIQFSSFEAAALKFRTPKILFFWLTHHARCLNVLPDFFLPALLLKEKDCCVGVSSCGCIIDTSKG